MIYILGLLLATAGVLLPLRDESHSEFNKLLTVAGGCSMLYLGLHIVGVA